MLHEHLVDAKTHVADVLDQGEAPEGEAERGVVLDRDELRQNLDQRAVPKMPPEYDDQTQRDGGNASEAAAGLQRLSESTSY